MTNVFSEGQPLSLILDAFDDGVSVYDRSGTLIWVNKKICQLLGISRAALIGLNVSEIATLPSVETLVTPEHADRSGSESFTPSQRIEDYGGPGFVTLKNGAQLLYQVHYVRDAQGALLYGVVTLREATDLNLARKQITELKRLSTLYQEQLSTLHTRVLGREIVYQSALMQRVFERAVRLARLDGNILLTGETGVGKSMLAQYLHVMSRRAQGPFIHVNCATLPASLVEAELFGYSEGAFTGASRKGRRGVIELGHGGTVFLDEIGDMPVEMQAKLLTVLEDKIIRRLGGEKLITVDVRFLAATNRSPGALLQEKTLRSDLYYRLAMNRIDLPPLRERPEDIPILIDSALAEFNATNGTALVFHRTLVDRLQTLPLPGNVREIKNLVWQLASESGEETGEITAELLPAELAQTLLGCQADLPQAESSGLQRDQGTDEAHRLRVLCQQYNGDVSALAAVLGVHRTTVVRKLKSYGLPYARKRQPRRP